MNILLIGSGGREHAMAYKISQSNLCTQLFIAPGNAGTIIHGKNVDLQPNDFLSVKQFLLINNVKMVVVGPEAPLVNGLVDFITNEPTLKNIMVIGPGKNGAKLEGSKDFAKQFMVKHQIPTAKYQSFNKDTLPQAINFLKTLNKPYVLKADGLAAGKGVLIINDFDEACTELNQMFSGKFGNAGNTVVIEEFLPGIELSVFVLTDGKNYVMLPEAKDYKRIGEGDTGLNTGGMGAVSPVAFAHGEFLNKVENQIVKPTVDGLANDGIEYKGFIFIGLMNVNGNPFVIEYNVRMGDPETEVVFPRLKTDVVKLFELTAQQKLNEAQVEIDSRTALTVMLVSEGYPESYEKGFEITGLQNFEKGLFFHAGTTLTNNKTVTSGGRVIACTAFGNSIEDAKKTAMKMAETIQFKGKYYRTDIGNDLL